VIDLSGKNVAVVGLGTSGLAAARLCLRHGARVLLNDAKREAELGSGVRDLVAQGASLVAGGHEGAGLEGMDLVVISPGVPSFPALARAERAGTRIVGEIELAVLALRDPPPIVAVGGTNGKSTTTCLIGAMLEAHGLSTFTGGNLGEPLADHEAESFEAIVLEVSSFQMERVETFKPRVSVLLNVTEDHLDRYESFAAYAHAKGNAFARQTGDDAAVVPHGDEVCLQEAARGRGRVVTFGPGGTLDVKGDAIVDTRSGERFARADIAIEGGHNALNAAAAIAAATELGVGPDTCRAVLASFRGLPHRMVLVGEVSGVKFYDDSKGTNVGAVVTALQGMVEPKAVLIAGGRDKGGSYAPLVQALREKGRAAVLIGEAADAIARAIGDALPVKRAPSLADAVRAGAALARPGDAVLLSPACSSYDMFRDYKHRGDEFVRAVQALARGDREERS
jgi:UDP-N-acetylmuramoylalanine--D-glutamate ligase